jgi:hypothetical protein
VASALRSTSQTRSVVNRGTLRRLADRDHPVEGEEGVGRLLDLGGRRARPQLIGDRLDHVAAVEVGGVGRQPLLDRGGHDLRPGHLPHATKGRADGLAVEPDLLRLRPPALAEALVGQVAVLGFPRLQGGDLAGTGGGVRSDGGEDLGTPGREGAEVVGVEALDLGDAVGDLLPADAEPAA